MSTVDDPKVEDPKKKPDDDPNHETETSGDDGDDGDDDDDEVDE